MKLVKLSDGRIIEITQKQFDQLNDISVVDVYKPKNINTYNKNEHIKFRITKYLKDNGETSRGKVLNYLRCNVVDFNKSVDSLVVDKILVITVKYVKHRGASVVEYLNLVE